MRYRVQHQCLNPFFIRSQLLQGNPISRDAQGGLNPFFIRSQLLQDLPCLRTPKRVLIPSSSGLSYYAEFAKWANPEAS